MAAWKMGFCLLVVLPCFLTVAGTVQGAEETAANAAAETHAPPPGPALDKGDQAWMLVSSALVLLMTAPGLALFYCGLVRKKNVLSVMMQCVSLMGLMTVVWALYGYSLSFGGSPDEPATYSPWIGNSDYLFMHNVQSRFENGEVIYPLEGSISRLTHMLFQGMFFIITPGLICGAFAERMKFSAMVLFSLLWGTIVYCPLCHWVWDAGILAFGAEGAWLGGALDFAGGTVVHISSGVSALVCALVLGKRKGYGQVAMPPHNLTYTVIGATLLWVGWFGFNAGSALNASGLAASAFCATHFAAAAGALTWPAAEWLGKGKPTMLGATSGAVAGLVCITPASGFVSPMAALAMGAIAGVVCFWTATEMKHRLGYDDSLDAFGVHGVGGTLGAILTGVFATRAVTDIVVSKGEPLGLLEGGKLLFPQIAAAAVTWIYAGALTFVLLKIVNAVVGLRVTEEEEVQGLDYSLHGEEGYLFLETD